MSMVTVSLIIYVFTNVFLFTILLPDVGASIIGKSDGSIYKYDDIASDSDFLEFITSVIKIAIIGLPVFIFVYVPKMFFGDGDMRRMVCFYVVIMLIFSGFGVFTYSSLDVVSGDNGRFDLNHESDEYTNVEIDLGILDVDDSFYNRGEYLDGNISDVSYSIDGYGGLEGEFTEYGGRDVRIILVIPEDVFEIRYFGIFESEKGHEIFTTIEERSIIMSFDLSQDSVDSFRLGRSDLVASGFSYGLRERSGDSLLWDIPVTGDENTVSIEIPKEYDMYGYNITIEPDDFLLKTRVNFIMGDAYYPLSEDRGGSVWYEVRDEGSYYDIVVHFTGGSGDVRIIVNPLTFDYLTWTPVISLLGYDNDRIASAGGGSGY